MSVERNRKMGESSKGDSVWQGESCITVSGDICKKAIDAFGMGYMLNVTMEEPAELIQAISKLRRQPYSPDIKYARAHLVEEMADCYIILEELAQMFLVSRDDINSVIASKQDRTLKRIAEYKATGSIDLLQKVEERRKERERGEHPAG